MIKNAFLLLITCFFALRISAQSAEVKVADFLNHSDLMADKSVIESSTIRFNDPKIEDYIQLMDSIDNESATQQGFRIQLHSISGPEAKESIFKFQSEFIGKHEDFASYANWSSPNWVLRIGNYRSRLEASQALENLKMDYPAAFILVDEIESPYKK